jgi:PAS domain S-box-containing protein
LYKQRNALEELTLKLENTISQLISSREKLRQSEEKYRDIFENANEGILIIQNGLIKFYNPKTLQILSCPNKDLLGKVFIDFVYPDFRENLQTNHFDKLGKKFNDNKISVRIIDENEDIKWVEINSVVINWEGETALLNFLSDISQRKIAEEEMKRARSLAEQASRTKSEFLANMSHEIRTPLNGIIGMTELVMMSPLEEDQKERLEAIKFSGESLLDIINDILDLSKIEARKLELDFVQFSLRGVIEKVLRPMSSKTAQKNLELILDISNGVPDYYTGDPVRLRQILFNLIGNAIKFTEKGEIKLEVRLKTESDNKRELEFFIIDTGIGIPGDKMHNLFKSFSQADSSTSRKFGGTGLGLSISKSLVEMMNGAISVESIPDKGSVFKFNIWLEISEEVVHESSTEIQPIIKQKRILIVDDNLNNRKILKGFLDHLGIENDEAYDGKQAYDKILICEGTKKHYDIILLDYHMPIMDGVEMARLMFTENKIVPLPDIIMLSSDDVSLQQFKIKDIGIKRCLIKPIFRDDLIQILNEVAGNVDVSQPLKKIYTQKNEENLQRKYQVLLAEDNIINQKLANGLLDKLGCKIKTVNNGKEALEAAKNNVYDIIFMDVQMPEMDGFEATGLIREWEKETGKHTPIVAMTAHAMKGDREKCINAGMDDYMTKPISLKILSETLKNLAL